MNETHLSADQHAAIARLTLHDSTLLVAPMGAGKTVIALTSFARRQHKRLLVVAPLRVCSEVWAREHLQFEHLKHLKIEAAIGDPDARWQAVVTPSDVLCVNYENLPWLLEQPHGCDALVVDEITKLRTPGGVQFKALRKRLNQFTWRVGLTGTPVSENWEGLYAMCLVLDGGATFGRNKEKFLNEHFVSFDGYRWTLLPGHAEQLTRALKPLLHVVPEYRHTLPPLDIEEIGVRLDASARMAYREMENTSVIDHLDLEAPNAAVTIGKLQQVASGFVYTNVGDNELLHTQKRRALEILMRESDQPVIIVYQFQAELDWLRARYPKAPVMAESKGLKSTTVRDWNAGRVPVLLMHPRSGGHGLNLAQGGARMIWIDPCWSRDAWDQTIARLWRRGQTKPVAVQIIISEDTVDEMILSRLDLKAGHHEEFKAFV
jgi:hypothetical protein